MILLFLEDIKAILTTLNLIGQLLHFIFALLLVIWRVRSRVSFRIHVVQRRLSILWITVLEAYTIKAQAAYLDFKRAVDCTVVGTFVHF